MGYAPNAAAAALRRGPSDTIGFLMHDAFIRGREPHHLSLLSQAVIASAHEQYKLVPELIHWGQRANDATPVDDPEVIRTRRVGGLVCLGAWSNVDFAQIERWALPSCQLGIRPKTPKTLHAVGVDLRLGVQQACQYLLALGHRRLMMVSGPTRHTANGERVKGFQESVAEFGLSSDEHWVVLADIDHAGENAAIREGYLRVQSALDQPATRRPTAVLCTNDSLALGAIYAALANGLAVPTDLSVIGCDDSFLAGGCQPALTSIRIDYGRWLRAAVRNVADQMRGHEIADRHTLLPCELIKRDSCAAPPTSPREASSR